jgi:hypothetical protein
MEKDTVGSPSSFLILNKFIRINKTDLINLMLSCCLIFCLLNNYPKAFTAIIDRGKIHRVQLSWLYPAKKRIKLNKSHWKMRWLSFVKIVTLGNMTTLNWSNLSYRIIIQQAKDWWHQSVTPTTNRLSHTFPLYLVLFLQDQVELLTLSVGTL